MDKIDYKKIIWLSGLVAIVTITVYVKYTKITLGLNFDTFGVIGVVAGINWFLWSIFKKWLWKYLIFNNWLVMIPDLNGSWSGTLQSTWIDNTTNKPIPQIETTAIIRQDLSTITIDFSTNEMESRSIIAEISLHPHRRVTEINYIYQSDPDAVVKHRSEIHYGAAKLIYNKNSKGETLKGDYWTDRKTTGTITLKRNI